MPFTIAQAARSKDTAGIRQRRLLDFTGPASYTTGGETLAANSVGLGTIEHCPDFTISDGTSVYLARYNRTTGKLQVYTSVAAGGAITGTVAGNVVVKGSGIGEAIGINPDSNAGVLSKAAATDRTIPVATFLGGSLTVSGTAAGGTGLNEVSAATNLSTFVGRCEVIGK